MYLSHLLIAAPIAFACCLLLLRLLLARGWLHDDVPNLRSMHSEVVPRGGGIAIVAAVLGVAGTYLVWTTDFESLILTLGAMLVLAAIGWLDDRHELKILPRLGAQIIITVLAITWIAWYPAGNSGPAIGPVTGLALVLLVVWITNLFNFMDGMDGLAGSQGVIVFTTYALWFYHAEAPGPAIVSAVAAAACIAFLFENWSPARVFMGDVGSLSIGVLIGILAVLAYARYEVSLGASLVLMLAFVFDATYTLLRRMFAGEKWWHAHRTHLYQRAAAFMQHRHIVLVVIVLDLVLAALATLMLYREDLTVPVLLASLALMVLILWQVSRGESRLTRGMTA